MATLKSRITIIAIVVVLLAIPTIVMVVTTGQPDKVIEQSTTAPATPRQMANVQTTPVPIVLPPKPEDICGIQWAADRNPLGKEFSVDIPGPMGRYDTFDRYTLFFESGVELSDADVGCMEGHTPPLYSAFRTENGDYLFQPELTNGFSLSLKGEDLSVSWKDRSEKIGPAPSLKIPTRTEVILTIVSEIKEFWLGYVLQYRLIFYRGPSGQLYYLVRGFGPPGWVVSPERTCGFQWATAGERQPLGKEVLLQDPADPSRQYSVLFQVGSDLRERDLQCLNNNRSNLGTISYPQSEPVGEVGYNLSFGPTWFGRFFFQRENGLISWRQKDGTRINTSIQLPLMKEVVITTITTKGGQTEGTNRYQWVIWLEGNSLRAFQAN